MSASSLLRSAGGVVRRSIPRGSFRRSPVRLLSSGGAGRFESSQHSVSEPNIGHTRRLEDSEMSFCRGAQHLKDVKEIAAGVRAARDKLRAIEQTVLQNDKWDVRRERVLICASVLLVATVVHFGPGNPVAVR